MVSCEGKFSVRRLNVLSVCCLTNLTLGSPLMILCCIFGLMHWLIKDHTASIVCNDSLFENENKKHIYNLQLPTCENRSVSQTI